MEDRSAFDAASVATVMEADLAAIGTHERAVNERRYLRSDLEFLGATVPAIRNCVRAVHRRWRDLDHGDVVALVEELWQRPVHERRFAACEVLVCYRDRLGPGDLPLVERLLREAGTWALVDPLATTVAGGLLETAPDRAAVLDRWVGDDNFWLRRAALLALLEPLRAGDGDWARFARYADGLLEEREFFIRKAIGWVLREVAKTRPQLVIDWLGPRTARASGVTVREAVRHLPADDRDRLLVAHRARRPA